MSKLVTFFLFLFLGCTILSAVMEGGGGVVATPLSVAVDDDDNTLQVAKTTDLRSEDTVIVGNEKVYYTGKTAISLTGCIRGYDNTTAAPHSSGTMVYTQEASIVNNALGFNIAATADSMGWWAVITIPFNFLTKTIPNVVTMNFSFLTGELGIIGWFLITMGAGFVIALAISLAGGRRV